MDKLCISQWRRPGAQATHLHTHPSSSTQNQKSRIDQMLLYNHANSALESFLLTVNYFSFKAKQNT